MTNSPVDSSGLSPDIHAQERMTNIRYGIVLLSVLSAFVLYLDRICMAEILKSDSFKGDINLTGTEVSQVLGAFFWCYALFQIPAGWLSDRFGARVMMSIYILTWSAATALMGVVNSLTWLVIFRMGIGFAQAGAYPTMSATVRRWINLSQRGRASSFISLGGGLGELWLLC